MPGGRPPKIADVIARREIRDPSTQEIIGYREITRADQIIEDLHRGLYLERAAKRADVDKTTVYEWQQVATRAQAAKLHDPKYRLSAHERRCIEFSHAVEVAEIEWEAAQNTALERLSRGEIEQVVTTIKVDAEGKTETTTKTSLTLPDAETIKWRLIRRFPHLYNPPKVIAGIDDEGKAVPLEVRVASLAEAARRFKSQASPDAVEQGE